MTMIILIRSALLAVLIIGAGLASASAGEGKEDTEARQRLAVSEHEAAEIAAAEGVTEIREIKVKRGQWKIEGTNEDGRKVEIRIDGDSGEVVKFETY